MIMTLEQILIFSNILVIPTLAYIIILERRITTMKVRLEALIDCLKDVKK